MGFLGRLFGCYQAPSEAARPAQAREDGSTRQARTELASKSSSSLVDAVLQVPTTSSLLYKSATTDFTERGQTDSLSELVSVMGTLTSSHGSVLARLQHVTSVVQEKQRASIASVTVVSMNGDAPTQTCLVACGPGRHRVRVGIPQPCSQLAELRTSTQGAYVVANICEKGVGRTKPLPPEWLVLHQQHGYNSFAAVPVCCNQQQVAILTLVFEQQCHRLHDERFVLQLKGLGHWMSKYFECGQLANVCQVLEELSSVTKIDMLVKVVSAGLTQLAAMKRHVQLSCRVALMRQAADAAMIFEEGSAPSRGVSQSAASDDSFCPTRHTQGMRRSSGCIPSFQGAGGTHDGSAHGSHGLGHMGHNAPGGSHGSAHAGAHGHRRSVESRVQQRRSLREGSSLGGTNSSNAAGGQAGTRPLECVGRAAGSSGSLGSLAPDADGCYWLPTGHPLALERTVLGQVMAEGAGTWVVDTTAWLQNPARPSRDMFVSPRGNKVHSMVVAVCSYEGSPLMGIYLTSPSAIGVSLLQVLLKDLEEWLEVLAPLLHQKLVQGDLAEDYIHISGILHHELSKQAQGGTEARISSPTPVRRTNTPDSMPRYSDLDSIRRSGDSDSPPASIGPGSASAAAKAVAAHKLHKVPGREPSFTVFQGAGGPQRMLSPMILGLQDRLRMLQIANIQEHAVDRPSDLLGVEVMEVIGTGGFGTVYHGWCNGVEVAIKVVIEREGDREVLRDALELAVLSTLSHPNILQVLTYFTNVVVIAPPDPPQSVPETEIIEIPGIGAVKRPVAVLPSPLPSNSGVHTPQQIRLLPAESAPEGSGPRALAICMEYCDRGSLSDAIAQGAFQSRVKGGYGALEPDMGAVLSTLLEMALALRHLHSLQLVHCDVKPSNVLLRSHVSDPRGFTAKLSDFGLAKMVMDGSSSINAPDRRFSTANDSELHHHLQRKLVQQKQQQGLQQHGQQQHGQQHGQQQQHQATQQAAQQPGQQQQQQQQLRHELSLGPQDLEQATLQQQEQQHEGQQRQQAGGVTYQLGPTPSCISGTITHMPPEVLASNSSVDYPADIYAFGIVMWEVLTGSQPYPGMDAATIRQKVVEEQLRPEFWPWSDESYVELAQRCWCADPVERPSAEELVQELNALMVKGGVDTKRRGRRHSSYTPQRAPYGLPLPVLVQPAAAAPLIRLSHSSGGSQKQRSRSYCERRSNGGISGDSFPLHIL